MFQPAAYASATWWTKALMYSVAGSSVAALWLVLRDRNKLYIQIVSQLQNNKQQVSNGGSRQMCCMNR